MEKERKIEILRLLISALKSGEKTIFDAMCQYSQEDTFSDDEFNWIYRFMGDSHSVPIEYRGEFWKGEGTHWWEDGKIEPSINYLKYLISKL